MPSITLMHALYCNQHAQAMYCTTYIGSPCGGLVLTAGVEVGDGVVEGGHLSKCILVVLLSLMNVVVLTTTVKLYLVPH